MCQTPETFPEEIRRPTASELYLYRVGSPELSDQQKLEIAEFTTRYPHNNASAKRFNDYLDKAWSEIVEELEA